MTKIVLFTIASAITFSVFASNTPNLTSDDNSEAQLELYEENENTIPAFLENETKNNSYSDEREGEKDDSEWLQYLCEGKTVFVKPEHRQWYDENCVLVLDK